MVEAKLLDRASQQRGDDRLVRLVAGIASAAQDRTLQQIAAQLGPPIGAPLAAPTRYIERHAA
jgi:hypothetical protein